jgi:hypothetical protein
MKRMRTVMFLILCAVYSTVTPSAELSGATYFIAVKNVTREQDHAGNTSFVDYVLLSYVFLTDQTNLQKAYLMPPGQGADRIALRDRRRDEGPSRDTIFFTASERYQDRARFNQAFPDGTYRFALVATDGEVTTQVQLNQGQHPEPAIMSLSQHDRPADLEAIDPEADLLVRWSQFAGSKPDPNGILDDIIFFIVKDCRGYRMLHSGRPFQGPHLTYTDTGYIVPGGLLNAGQEHTLIVDHAFIEGTTVIEGIVGAASYAQTTRLKIRTIGEDESRYCHGEP